MTEILQQRLIAMRQAAPQAGIHLLIGPNGFTVLLGEAKAAHEITPLVRLTNHGDDWGDVLEGRICHTDMPAALEALTTSHTVALMDMYCEQGYKGRPVMFCLLPAKVGEPLPVKGVVPVIGEKPKTVEDDWA